jgi:hypothetical protein
MEDNLTIILRQFERLKGQLVITASWEIERLIAISSDKWDYYYVTYNGRKLIFNSCVSRLIQLKDKIDKEDYNELIRIAKLNNYDYIVKDEKDRKQIRDDLLSVFYDDDTEILLTEVFWELN